MSEINPEPYDELPKIPDIYDTPPEVPQSGQVDEDVQEGPTRPARFRDAQEIQDERDAADAAAQEAAANRDPFVTPHANVGDDNGANDDHDNHGSSDAPGNEVAIRITAGGGSEYTGFEGRSEAPDAGRENSRLPQVAIFRPGWTAEDLAKATKIFQETLGQLTFEGYLEEQAAGRNRLALPSAEPTGADAGSQKEATEQPQPQAETAAANSAGVPPRELNSSVIEGADDPEKENTEPSEAQDDVALAQARKTAEQAAERKAEIEQADTARAAAERKAAEQQAEAERLAAEQQAKAEAEAARVAAEAEAKAQTEATREEPESVPQLAYFVSDHNTTAEKQPGEQSAETEEASSEELDADAEADARAEAERQAALDQEVRERQEAAERRMREMQEQQSRPNTVVDPPATQETGQPVAATDATATEAAEPLTPEYIRPQEPIHPLGATATRPVAEFATPAAAELPFPPTPAENVVPQAEPVVLTGEIGRHGEGRWKPLDGQEPSATEAKPAYETENPFVGMTTEEIINTLLNHADEPAGAAAGSHPPLNRPGGGGRGRYTKARAYVYPDNPGPFPGPTQAPQGDRSRPGGSSRPTGAMPPPSGPSRSTGQRPSPGPRTTAPSGPEVSQEATPPGPSSPRYTERIIPPQRGQHAQMSQELRHSINVGGKIARITHAVRTGFKGGGAIAGAVPDAAGTARGDIKASNVHKVAPFTYTVAITRPDGRPTVERVHAVHRRMAVLQARAQAAIARII